jgi:hypothetical protein
MRRPRIGTGSGLRNGVERVEKVTRQVRQPVEAGHKEGVAVAEGGDRALQLAPVGLRAAGRLAENLLGSGGALCLHWASTLCPSVETQA